MKSTQAVLTTLTILMIGSLLFGQKKPAKKQAQDQQKVIQDIIKQMPLCDTSDTLIEPLGYQCKTAKGGLFEKRQNSEGDFTWIDLRNRKSWLISSVGGRSWEEARRFCERSKYQLPKDEDFLLGETTGFRGIFQPDARTRYFWTANQKNPQHAHVFSAISGQFEIIPLLFKRNTKASVVCVKSE